MQTTLPPQSLSPSCMFSTRAAAQLLDASLPLGADISAPHSGVVECTDAWMLRTPQIVTLYLEQIQVSAELIQQAADARTTAYTQE